MSFAAERCSFLCRSQPAAIAAPTMHVEAVRLVPVHSSIRRVAWCPVPASVSRRQCGWSLPTLQ